MSDGPREPRTRDGSDPVPDAPPAGAAASGDPGDEVDGTTPRGTLFTLMIYIMVLAGMWGVLYWTMLSR